MHKLGEFLQDQMDLAGMDRPELVRRSGLTRQHVHTLLTKPTLSRMPDMQTMAALGRAFPQVGEDTFIWKAAEAVGVPVDRLVTVQPDPDAISNEMLLELLRRRLERGEGHDRPAATTQPPPSAGGGNVRTLHPGEGPPDEVVPLDLAADVQPGPSGYDRAVADQELAGEENQGDGATR